jgi:hypothetical protein
MRNGHDVHVLRCRCLQLCIRALKRIGRTKAVEGAWKDPVLLEERRRICGENEEFVFPYKRKTSKYVL